MSLDYTHTHKIYKNILSSNHRSSVRPCAYSLFLCCMISASVVRCVQPLLGSFNISHFFYLQEVRAVQVPVVPWWVLFLVIFFFWFPADWRIRRSVLAIFLMYSWTFVLSSRIVVPTLTSPWPPSFHLACSLRVLDVEWNSPSITSIDQLTIPAGYLMTGRA